MPEAEFETIFQGCEVGAEPPFGGLYGMPVVVDQSLTRFSELVFRAGSHVESLELRYDDFARLEHPMVAQFARPPVPVERWSEERPESRP